MRLCVCVCVCETQQGQLSFACHVARHRARGPLFNTRSINRTRDTLIKCRNCAVHYVVSHYQHYSFTTRSESNHVNYRWRRKSGIGLTREAAGAMRSELAGTEKVLTGTRAVSYMSGYISVPWKCDGTLQTPEYIPILTMRPPSCTAASGIPCRTQLYN